VLSNTTYFLWAALVGLILWGVKPRLPLPILFFVGYAALTTIYQFYHIQSMELLIFFVKQSGLFSLLSLLLAAGALMVFVTKPGFFHTLWAVSGLYSVWLSACVLWSGRAVDLYFFDNPTQAAWWIAVTSIGVLDWQLDKKARWGVLLFFAAAILRADATIPLLAFIPAFLVILWKDFPHPILRFGVPAVLAILALYLHPLANWLESGARFQAWEIAYRWWFGAGWASILFGQGLGSVKFMVPHLQRLLGIDGAGSMYIWLHNDYLQVLVELGAVGFLLFFWAVGFLLEKAKRHTVQWVSLIAYGILMTVQFPVRWPIMSFLGLILVGNVLSQEEWTDASLSRGRDDFARI
jgi:hypothetical protein